MASVACYRHERDQARAHERLREQGGRDSRSPDCQRMTTPGKHPEGGQRRNRLACQWKVVAQTKPVPDATNRFHEARASGFVDRSPLHVNEVEASTTA